MAKQYISLAELRTAYISGELSQDNVLCIDNDSSYLAGEDVQIGKPGWGLSPRVLLEEALDLLGIPWENV